MVTVNPTPAIPSITNADDYCDYDTVQTMIAAGNNGTYAWYTDFAADSVGSTYTTPSVIGTYNLALTETNIYGCESEADSTTVNFFESPTLDSLVLTNVTGGCADSTGAVQLFATGGDGSYTSYANIYGITTMSATSIFNNLPAGTYTEIEVEDGNGCFSDTLNATLTAPGQPSLVELLSVDAVYCLGDAISSLTANDSSASTAGNLEWYTDLGLNNLYVSGNTAVPATAVGVTTYYVVENNNGCKGPSQAVTVRVNALPTTLVVANVEYCIGDVINDLTVNGAGGTYDWYTDMGLTTMLASGDTVTPSLTTVGSETYYVVETDTNGCTSIADSTMMTIHALPIVTIATIADICENDGSASLSSFATPSGATGFWSADSGLAINGTVNPNTMGGAGTYAVVYTYTDANSCVSDDTSSITINAEPVVTFSGVSDVCFDQASSTLAGGLPLTGSYVGNGVSNGAFDPAVAGIGSSVLTYNYTDGNGCSSSDVDTLIVNAIPTPNAGVDQTICFGDVATLVASGGTSYAWSNATGTDTNVVSPATTLAYAVTVTDNNSCSAVDSVTVNVDALPIVTFTSLSSVCVNGAPQPLVTGLPVNGSYSGSGNASTGTFSPGSAGSGLHILTYTYTDPTTLCINSDTTTVVVDTLPNVLFANQSNICDGSAPVNVTGGSPTNGTYSGPGVTAAMFDAAAAGGTGTYTLTYSFTDGNGCASSANATIIVDSLPNITWVAFNDLCDNDGVATLTEASPAGGTYTGTGVGGGQFDPAAAGGQGSYVVSYNFTDANGCASSSTQSITVNPSPVVAMTYTDSVLCNNITQTTLDAGAGGAVYAWDQDGFPVGTGQQTYVATAAGTYTVEVTNNFTCSNTDSYLVEDVGECISVQSILGDNVSVIYYPNPTSGTLNIDVDGLAGKTINLNIVSMHGQEVYNTTIENAPAQLRDVVDLSGEAQGVYFVKITSGEYHSVQRISVR